MDRFLRDYLSAKTRTTPAFKGLYEEFKDYLNKGQFDTEDLLIDMLKYSNNYRILLTGDVNGELGQIIIRLNQIETKVTRPYFLEILKAQDENKLEKDTVLQVFKIIENYIFRRKIAEVPTNALNKIFLTLYNETFKIEQNLDNYIDKLNYILLNKGYSGRLPKDDEVVSNKLRNLLQD